MAHATPEKKFMTRMPPRSGFVGCLPATNAVTVADLTAFANGNAYTFFQADGADLYFMTAGTVGGAQQINPQSPGIPGSLGSTGGSIPSTPGNLGCCGLLKTSVEPQYYILEPGQDSYMGFIVANPAQTGWLRWWRGSMVSNG